MRSANLLIFVATLCAASEIHAQPAQYDGSSGVLTIPSVLVGTTNYGSVQLQNIGNYTFTLQAAYGQPALTTAEGVWRGNAGGSLITCIMLDNGVFYLFQTVPGSPNTIEGFTHGNSTSGGGLFTASNAKAFNFVEGVIQTPGAMNGSYQARQWFVGSAKDDTGQDVYFGAFFDSLYDVVPSMAEIAGTYSGQARFGPPFGVQNLAVTLNESGNASGSAGTCNFAGAVTPRQRGNLYDLSITFGSGCDFQGQTFNGIAFLDKLMQRLMVAGLNAQRTGAGMFIATK